MQGLIERIILWSRYILIVFYVGLGAGLAIFAGKFFLNLWSMGNALPTATDNDMLLAILVLIDKSLVAGLVVMVMLTLFSTVVDAPFDWKPDVALSRLRIGYIPAEFEVPADTGRGGEGVAVPAHTRTAAGRARDRR